MLNSLGNKEKTGWKVAIKVGIDSILASYKLGSLMMDSMPWKQELVHKITRVLTFQALEISSAGLGFTLFTAGVTSLGQQTIRPRKVIVHAGETGFQFLSPIDGQ